MIAVLIATFGAVFVAEIVGDKLLYTTGVLATRYRTVPDHDRHADRLHGEDGRRGGRGKRDLEAAAACWSRRSPA